jgi:hypothetical protein
MWRSRSSSCSDACRTQLARAFLDGFAPGFQCGSPNPAVFISPGGSSCLVALTFAKPCLNHSVSLTITEYSDTIHA